MARPAFEINVTLIIRGNSESKMWKDLETLLRTHAQRSNSPLLDWRVEEIAKVKMPEGSDDITEVNYNGD